MVRLADLPDWDRQGKLDKVKELTGFDARPWVRPPPLARCRIAIVTTAGLHRKSDRPFGPSATDYRIIPGTTKAAELIMSHQSVNFDRTGFQEDHNVAFPIDRLNESARREVIGSVAAYHYSFMGATQIRQLEAKAHELAGLLKRDHVNVVLLTPVSSAAPRAKTSRCSGFPPPRSCRMRFCAANENSDQELKFSQCITVLEIGKNQRFAKGIKEAKIETE